ncbi:MAG: hypothetical protein ACI8S6_004388, partial [Myxococcota bacterium]
MDLMHPSYQLLLCVLLVACAREPVVLSGVTPGAVCATAPDALVLTGSGMTPAITNGLGDGAAVYLPEVTLTQGDQTVLLTGDDERLRWSSDREMQVVLSAGLAAGSWDVAVSRLDGETASLSAAFDALAAPTISELTPSLCHDRSDAPLQLSGAGFAFLGDSAPAVRVGDQVSAHTVTGGGCAVTGGPLSASVCDTLDAEVDATGLPLGWVSLSVDNPDPA